MKKVKRLPYGISDFRQLRREGKYYVDKTMFLPRMEEQDNFLFLIRPRRFGKSVFLSMLSSYYDINEKENFESLFEGLWIANHPTPERGTFQVLYFDFSQVGSDIDHLEKSFDQYCSICLDRFAEKYGKYYPNGFVEAVKAFDNSRAKLSYINLQAKAKSIPLYLIIDEYDNFTNTVLNEKGEAIYHALTHASGFYRDTFKLYKPTFSRILMMGVSPVTMDDLTSGYNIASNISTSPFFNLMLGFSEEDVRNMIRYYQEAGMLQADEEVLIAEMKPWYDNYCFAESVVNTDPKMFNCDMVCYYLNQVMQYGRSPRQMIDPNTRTDYNKMRKLIQLDKLDGNRKGILHDIATRGFIYATVADSFPAEELTKKEMFVSLLFYYGMLTIGDVRGAQQKLVIPNNNVRKQYYGYLLEEYDKIASINTLSLNNAYATAAIDGDWHPMITEITEAYKRTTSVRQLIEGERNLQGFMNAYLSLNPYYLTAPEMELGHGYCDFFLMPDLEHYDMVEHSYILELKYLTAHATEREAKEQWEQAVEQIVMYKQSPMTQQLIRHTTLHPIVIQIKGYEAIRIEEIC